MAPGFTPVDAEKTTVLPLATVCETGWPTKAIGLPEALAFTARKTGALVTEPFRFVTVTVYAPALDATTPTSWRIGPVAPGMGAPSKFHWYWSCVPEATTQNAASAPILAEPAAAPRRWKGRPPG